MVATQPRKPARCRTPQEASEKPPDWPSQTDCAIHLQYKGTKHTAENPTYHTKAQNFLKQKRSAPCASYYKCTYKAVIPIVPAINECFALYANKYTTNIIRAVKYLQYEGSNTALRANRQFQIQQFY